MATRPGADVSCDEDGNQTPLATARRARFARRAPQRPPAAPGPGLRAPSRHGGARSPPACSTGRASARPGDGCGQCSKPRQASAPGGAPRHSTPGSPATTSPIQVSSATDSALAARSGGTQTQSSKSSPPPAASAAGSRPSARATRDAGRAGAPPRRAPGAPPRRPPAGARRRPGRRTGRASRARRPRRARVPRPAAAAGAGSARSARRRPRTARRSRAPAPRGSPGRPPRPRACRSRRRGRRARRPRGRRAGRPPTPSRPR